MLETSSFKDTIVFQAFNALTQAQANAEARNQIAALQAEVQRLTGEVARGDRLLNSAEKEVERLRAELDAAVGKLREIANEAARTMLSEAAKPAGPQDEPVSEGGTPD